MDKVTSWHFCVIMASLLSLSACKTDFEISGDFEERAIVHFLIDPNDSHHFLKVNKTFLGEGNATIFAQVADSSYFDEVIAVVKEVTGGTLVAGRINGGTVQREWTLKDTTITNKQPGAFYYPEQKLYYFEANDLNENALYSLDIEINGGKHKVSGATALVNGVNITTPASNTPLNFAEANVPVNGYRSQPIRFTKGTGALFNVKIYFRYKEVTASGSEIKEVVWNLGDTKSSDMPSNNGLYAANGEQFYEFLKNNIPDDESVIRREVENIEIRLTAGSEDLLTYITANQPSSSITQNKPEFSNIAGALGIFSARTTKILFRDAYNPLQPNQRALNVNSTRELCLGFHTFVQKNLKFCSNIPSDIGQGYNFVCD